MEYLINLNKDCDKLEDILSGKKVMMVLASYGKQFPYGRIHVGETVYFTDNCNFGLIKAEASICNSLCLENVSKDETAAILVGNKEKLNLSLNNLGKLMGKKHLVFIEFGNVRLMEPVQIYNNVQLETWTDMNTVIVRAGG